MICDFFKQIAYDAKSLRIPEIRWLGAFLSDYEKYQFPQQCLLPLTAEDKQKAGGLLNRCYMEREVPYWRSELQLMLDRGVKFEIEALSAHSLTFLSENYLPSKIQEGAYI
ncbi:Meiotic recombination protein SPO11-1 [Sesamum alatum]|uniref:Meiotic recombination protein SPO11-1 n=1 Tax=Sesamum alatum TaxID=300844 RepID=A0AAE1Z1L5_9LAMI|nr:Meiotic recombination protein SPO11-1 [Sesamum alatum]